MSVTDRYFNAWTILHSSIITIAPSIIVIVIYCILVSFPVINDDAGETEAIADEEDEMTDPGNIIRSTDKNPFLNFNNFSHGLVY